MPNLYLTRYFKSLLCCIVFLINFNSSAQKWNSEIAISSGQWLKYNIPESGMYRISASELENNGLSLNQVSLEKVQVFSTGGQALAEPVASIDYSILPQIASQIFDKNSNGIFDGNDYIVFYAEAAKGWLLNNSFRHYVNIYDDNSYYYIGITENTAPKRMSSKEDGLDQEFSIELNKTNQLFFHEQDETNFVSSGRIWLGNRFVPNTPFLQSFQIDNALNSSILKMNFALATSTVNNSNMTIKLNGKQIHNQFFRSISGDKTNLRVNYKDNLKLQETINGSTIDLELNYLFPDLSALAWIDYIEIVAERQAIHNGNQWLLCHEESLNKNVKYSLDNAINDVLIYKVDNFKDVFIQKHNQGSFVQGAEKNLVPYYIVDNNSFKKPIFVEKLQNSSLTNIKETEYIIVSKGNLMAEAQRLANFHLSRGLEVQVVDVDEIFKVFSSGKKDVSAIRNYVKYIYDHSGGKDGKFKYLLLFGDASFDYKDRLENNTNIVPVFQSLESFEPTNTYASDDYYGFMDSTEGLWNIDPRSTHEILDISTGRLPVSNPEEAKIVVDKIIRYYEPEAIGKWRNKITFVADDEDYNRHFNDVEDLTDIIAKNHPLFNINKIYLDAHQQTSFGSTDRYPDVNRKIKEDFENGCLVFSYIGHGGDGGMAHEDVITREVINELTNKNRLPLVVTATCELSRYDDPSFKSPGELFILNPNGGAIALITTSRVVYISENTKLNKALVEDNLFADFDGRRATLGEIYRRAKNNSGRDQNLRNFILLGDPALNLAFPEKEVVITSINDVNPNLGQDTLFALSKVRLEGEIRENNQMDADFNGTIYAEIFDKPTKLQTLANDANSTAKNFELRNSVLFSGKSQVKNGQFSLEFYMPKDINYSFGNGRISLYASAENDDAAGHNESFIIGGSDFSNIENNQKPEMQLFIDDTLFTSGGITNKNPKFIGFLNDDFGINSSIGGIGREMLLTLDKGTENQKEIIVNNFYETDLGSFNSGVINYQLNNLSQGEHTLHLKVWDVHNNSAEGSINFNVVDSDDPKMSDLINYPNPFKENTTIKFTHNLQGKGGTVELIVFDISGRELYNTNQQVNELSNAFEINLEENGSWRKPITASGLLFYKVKLMDLYGRSDTKTGRMLFIGQD